MPNITSVQIFALLAVAGILLVSYYPPAQNAAAIFTLAGSFLGHLITRLFDAPSDSAKNVSASQVEASDSTTAQGV